MSAVPRFLLVGWEGADWPLLNPLLDKGGLPTLNALIGRGVAGRLGCCEPPVKEAVWATLLTGRSADEHGIAAAAEPDPVTGGVRPIGGTARRVKALWNILAQSGWRVGVVGFPATHPAEPVPGVFVTDEFARPLAPVGQTWPVPKGSLHPPECAAELADLRVHPGELNGSDLLPFIRDAARHPPRPDDRLAALAGMLAENVSRHAIACRLLEQDAVDAVMVYYDLIGAARRLLVPRAGDAVYAESLAVALRFHDLLLGRLLDLVGMEAAVMLVSPAVGPTTSRRAREGGLLCLAGKAVCGDQLSLGAGVLDVVPSVLAWLGLPAGCDMPGRVLPEISLSEKERRIDSWETQPGDSGARLADPPESQPFADTAMVELARLGYRDTVTPEAAVQVDRARAAAALGRARAARGRGRIEAAIRHCEVGLSACPGDIELRILLAQLSFRGGDLARCRELVAGFTGLAADPQLAHYVDALLALASGEMEGARSHLAASELAAPSPDLQAALARAYLDAGRPADAERLAQAMGAAEPAWAAAHTILALALLAQGRPQAAATAAREAIRLDFHVPEAHVALAQSLRWLGDEPGCRQALAIASRWAPAEAPAPSSGEGNAW